MDVVGDAVERRVGEVGHGTTPGTGGRYPGLLCGRTALS